MYEYAVTDFENFQSNLLKRLPISDATLAPCRKSRNPRATPIQLTFKNKKIPKLLKIAREQLLTKVYEQKHFRTLQSVSRIWTCGKALQGADELQEV